MSDMTPEKKMEQQLERQRAIREEIKKIKQAEKEKVQETPAEKQG